MKFNHLNVPDQWQQYWSRYPEGYTILEALISWVSQVDEMTDNVNNWNEYLDDFVVRFDERLQGEVTNILAEWQQSGFLDVVVSEALDTKYHEMDNRLTTQLAEITQEVDITVTVGASGDYNTITEALNYLSLKNKRRDRKAEIKILSGHIVKTQVTVDGDNLGWVKITSEDSFVRVDLVNPAPQIKLPAYGNYSPVSMTGLFAGDNNAVLPVIDVLFDMQTSTSAISSPFCVANGAQLTILKGKGCINAKGSGLFAIQGGKIYAMGANVQGASSHGISAWRGAYVIFGGGIATNCGQSGAYVDVCGTLNADSADFSNCAQQGLMIDQASTVSAVNAVMNKCKTGIAISYGSHASLKNVQANDCSDYGLRVISSHVEAEGLSVANAGVTGVQATKTSLVNCYNINASGAKSYGIWSVEGSNINARDAKAQKTVGTDSSTDIRVSTGGIINAEGAKGGLVQPANTITNNGIIFKNLAP